MFNDNGFRRAGVVEGWGDDAVISPLPADTDVLQLLDDRAGDDWVMAAARRTHPALPGSIVGAGAAADRADFLTFEEHVDGVRRSLDGEAGVIEQWHAAPTFHFTNPYLIIGPVDDVPIPPGSTVLDFELEVAAVIGRAGRNLTADQARDVIVGYTIFNDWSARDLQQAEMKVGLGPAKGKDTSSTLGPWLVTPDELEHYRDADGFPGPGAHRVRQ